MAPRLPTTRLLVRLGIYYSVITVAVYVAARAFPPILDYMPIGGAQRLLTGAAIDPFEAIEIGASRVSNLRESIIWLAIAVIAAIVTVLPVAWTYMAVRVRDEYEQSLVETIILLPIIVTSVVVIVHNSLALAFSLAGIVGAVRFRNTLKSTGDALFVFLATVIGLSAGTGAIEVAIVMSVVFNFALLTTWAVDFGGAIGRHDYLRNHDAEPERRPVLTLSPADPAKKRKKKDRRK